MLRQIWSGASLSTSAANSQNLQLGPNKTRSSVNLITFLVAGTLNGAQCKLQIGATNSAGTLNFYDIASTTISAAGSILNIEVADGFTIRPYLYSVSAGVTSVDAWIGTGSYVR